MEVINFFPYSWNIDENEKEYTLMRVYGLNKQNESVLVIIDDFTPYIYLELPEYINWTNEKANRVVDKLGDIIKTKPLKKRLVYKMKLYGANVDEKGNKKTFPFLFLSFSSKNTIFYLERIIRKEVSIPGLGRFMFKMHEHNATPILQLIAVKKLSTSSWLLMKGIKVKHDQISLCKHEYHVGYNYIKLDSELTLIPKPIVLSYDIEVNSTIAGSMPKPERLGDVIFQISCVLRREGDNDMKKYILTLGNPCQKTLGEDIIIIKFDTEFHLLSGFSKFIRDNDINVIIGYNIFGFDIDYMIKRTQKVVPCLEFTMQGYLKDVQAKEKTISWSSSAFKNQHFQFLDAEGRLFVDLLPLIRRDYKFSDFKLKTVSTHFLGESKDPLTAKGIFKCYRLGMKGGEKGDRALGICGKYCVQDSVLVMKIFEKIHSWIGLIEMAKIFNVPIFYLYSRGQQIKTFSQVYIYALSNNYVVEKDAYVTPEDENYLGAHVFDPVPGVYDKVVTMDFCLTGDTLITMSNGLSIRIDNIKENNMILGYNIDKKGFNNYPVNHGLQDKGKMKTIKLHLKYGETITCTPDHKFLLEDDTWEKAENLKGKYVKCGIKYPEDTTCEKEQEWVLDTEGFTLNMKENRERSLAFSRMLGYILSDGCIYISKKYSRKCSEVYLGTLFDAQMFKKDILLFSDIDVTIRCRNDNSNKGSKVKGQTYCISLPSSLSKMIHSLEDIIVGKRSHQAMKFPKFILDENCPLSIIREFIAGLFGGDACVPFLYSSNRFSSISFKWTTIEKYKEEMKGVFENIRQLLLKFDVYCGNLLCKPIYYYKNSIKPRDYVENPRYDFLMSITDDCCYIYSDKIGLRYCINKLYKLYIGSMYHGFCCKVREQHKYIVEKTHKYSLDKAMTKFMDNNIPLHDVIFTSTKSKKIPRLRSRKDFNSPVEFLNDLGVKHWFDKGSYIINDEIFIPSFRQKIIEVTDNGIEPVYDIEVDDVHNFIGNGIVLSNCSLYPSVIIAYNIDWSTWVIEENYPDEKCNVIEWDEHVGCEHDNSIKKIKPKIILCGHKKIRFLKEPLGLLPNILINGLQERKNVKHTIKIESEKMKTINNEEKEKLDLYLKVLDKRQLSIKIGLNSMYGSLGTRTGYLPFMAGAMATTAMGRESVLKAADYVVKEHKAKLIYGDSVTGDTPLLLKDNNNCVHIKTIESLGEDWVPYNEFKSEDTNRKEKQQSSNDMKIWTKDGWAKIIRVIKHKTKKKIYRINTHTGCIDVTEDHSLLDIKGNKVKPSSVNVGQELMHSFPKDFSNLHNKFLLKEKILLKNFENVKKQHLLIYGKIKSQKMYYLLKSLGYNLKCDLCYDNSDIYKITIYKDYKKHTKNIKKIIELRETRENEFVYDIETEYGNFNGGVGEITVSNSDSVFLNFPHLNTAEEIWDHSIKVAEDTSKLFKKPMQLEFEQKIYWRFLILTKKRYMSLECDKYGNVSKEISKKGVMLVRRDNSKAIRDIYASVVMDVFNRVPEEEVIYKMIQHIIMLCKGGFQSNDFVITKSVRDVSDYKIRPLSTDENVKAKRLNDLHCTEEEYNNKALPAQCQLLLKMQKRGDNVSSGTRLSYIVLDTGNKKAKLFDKIEDISFYKDYHEILKLKIDYLYYFKLLSNQLEQVINTVYNKDKFISNLYKELSKTIDLHYKLQENIKKYNYPEITEIE